MASERSMLLIDSGERPMRSIAERLRTWGYRVVEAKTPEEAHECLVDPRHEVGAALVTPDLPTTDLGGAVAALRRVASHPQLPVLVVADRSHAVERERLRAAGIDLVLFEPIDDHTLRFQTNRALSDSEGVDRERQSLRVPTDWPVRIRVGSREKEARVYSISAAGAYLATARPSLPNALVYLTLPLPEGSVTATARVVMTNVPGNLQRENLPVGMGVRFTGTPEETERAIEAFAQARNRHLVL